ncbi:helix-turn-helix domain-containing protein [Streptomyces sp. NPDC048612]|uniref:helix-turn-helix domain-containing protein n=1 Tax=Streptomyces sp. NPDC048612 TaxID=3365579 RepID=UPI003711EB67
MPRGRALAPLSDGLGTEERAFAEHLRNLRERVGMTSADLAAALCVDPTRLSRYLSGQSLPEPQLLTRFHQLLAGRDVVFCAEDAVREGRALLYAAARSKGPLSARAYEVAELQEKMHEQQADTARSLAALQGELQEERDRRHCAEQEIERLRQASAADHGEQVRQLEAQRDHALRRVAELEDLVAQTGSLLQLQQDDVRHAQEMAQATAGELQRWEDGEGPLLDQDEDGIVPWLDGGGMTFESAVEKLAELRDRDQALEADLALRNIATETPPAVFGAFYRMLIGHGRELDAGRLLHSAAVVCDGLRLRQLLIGTNRLREVSVPLVAGLDSATGLSSYTEKDTSCSDSLVRKIGIWTPTPAVAQLYRALSERSENSLRVELTFAVSDRTRGEKRELREAGVPYFGAVYKRLHRWT